MSQDSAFYQLGPWKAFIHSQHFITLGFYPIKELILHYFRIEKPKKSTFTLKKNLTVMIFPPLFLDEVPALCDACSLVQ